MATRNRYRPLFSLPTRLRQVARQQLVPVPAIFARGIVFCLLVGLLATTSWGQPRRYPRGRFVSPPFPVYTPLAPVPADPGYYYGYYGPPQGSPPHVMEPPGVGIPVLPVSAVQPPRVYQGDFHLEVSESLLQQLIRRQEISSGGIQDFALGAAINGQQTTQSQVRVDCIPCNDGAQFDFIVEGVVNSETIASTPQANIQQQGNTQFQATKRVLLNGESVLTQKSLIQVLPNQTVLGAQARPGPLPMFGNLADRIAYRAALAKLPESNLVAGQKVIDRLQPELDGKIDAELSQTNQLLREHLWKRLKEWNVSPDYKAAFSTSDRLCWDYRLNSQPISWTPGPAAAGLPVPGNTTTTVVPAVTDDVVIRAHDSLFETVANRQQLGGKTISLNDLRDATDRFLLLLAQEVPSESTALPLAVNFTFDKKSPLHGIYRDNILEVILHGTFQAGNLPKTATQQIRLRVETLFEQETFTIKVTDVQVRELGADGSVMEPGITQSAIAAQLKSQMTPITLKRNFFIPTQTGGGVNLFLAGMTSGDHWLNITLDAQSPAPDGSRPSMPQNSLTPVPDPTFQPDFQPTAPFGPVFPTQ